MNLSLLTLTLYVAGCRGSVTTVGRKYFQYDEVLYYHNDIKETDANELYGTHSKSVFDSMKTCVITEDGVPNSIKDLSFIPLLKKMGYHCSKIDTTQFSELNEIFSEKKAKEPWLLPCTPVYRDILIFKRRHKVIGIAKICFGCYSYVMLAPLPVPNTLVRMATM